MADITSANAILMLAVPLVLPVPQQIQQFAADDMFDIEDVDATELMMGVDGTLSGGMIYAPKPMNIALAANSPSIDFFDAWYNAQQAATATYAAQGTVTLPALGKSYGLVTGYLSRWKPMADAKKILQPRRFRITWQSIIVSPVGSAG